MVKNKAGSSSARSKMDERVRRSKDSVLAATSELLSEKGFAGVTVDEVSDRSGVAKTTIYRHWPTRSALLLDACSKLGQKPKMPDTGSMKKDLELLAIFIATQLRSSGMACVLPSILDAAERDRDIAELLTNLHNASMAPFRLALERAQQRGEMSKSRDPSAVIAAIMGPLFYRRWFSREPIDDKFVKGVVERAVAPSRK